MVGGRGGGGGRHLDCMTLVMLLQSHDFSLKKNSSCLVNSSFKWKQWLIFPRISLPTNLNGLFFNKNLFYNNIGAELWKIT